MNKSIYDSKIIILDIDFLEINRYNLDDILYTKKLLLELAASQNLVFITDNNCNCAFEVLDNLGIKSGFLISNSGSSITNIANKKIVLETMMPKEICNIVANKCIWNNLNFSINTKTTTYPYRMINNWITKKYKADLSHLYKFAEKELHNSYDVKKCINENDIRSLEIYFLENNDELRKKYMREKIIETVNFETISFVINSSALYVIPTIISKFKVLEYLAKKQNWDLKNNGLYCGIGQCSTEICQNVYFPIVTKESILKKDHKPFPEDIEVEEIPRGTTSWITWFYKNTHLWSGEEEKLKLSLPKNKNAKIDLQSIESLKEGSTKFLTFNLSAEKNILMKSNFKKLLPKKQYKKYQNNQQTIQIGFWKNQVPHILKLIDK